MNKALSFQINVSMTRLLLITLTLIFVIQGVTGVDMDTPSRADMQRWGANVLPLTATTEPWRLLTSVFVHIGWVHLLLNAFVLWLLGQVAERLFGRWLFVGLFVLAGIGGSLVTSLSECFQLWQQAYRLNSLANDIQIQQMSTISAGASAGIFGIGGSLLVYMLCLHRQGIKGSNAEASGHTTSLRQEFTALNEDSLWEITPQFLAVMLLTSLLYGFMDTQMDNAGHIGGLLVGGYVGWMYFLCRHAPTAKKTADWLSVGLILLICLILFAWFLLHLWYIKL